MTLTNIEKEIITKQIEDVLNDVHIKSWYFQKDEYVIRVSDHLPNLFNFEKYNEDVDKIVLIMPEKSVNTGLVERFIDENDDKEIIFIPIDGEYITSENFDTIPEFRFF